jgi:hypothetical protein
VPRVRRGVSCQVRRAPQRILVRGCPSTVCCRAGLLDGSAPPGRWFRSAAWWNVSCEVAARGLFSGHSTCYVAGGFPAGGGTTMPTVVSCDLGILRCLPLAAGGRRAVTRAPGRMSFLVDPHGGPRPTPSAEDRPHRPGPGWVRSHLDFLGRLAGTRGFPGIADRPRAYFSRQMLRTFAGEPRAAESRYGLGVENITWCTGSRDIAGETPSPQVFVDRNLAGISDSETELMFCGKAVNPYGV